MENTNRVTEQARYDAERRQADEALEGVVPTVSIFGSSAQAAESCGLCVRLPSNAAAVRFGH